MSRAIEIRPANRPLSGSIRPPGSKSLTNRALPCAALAHGTSQITGVLDSDDTRYMADALEMLGIQIEADWDAHVLRVQGCSGRIPASEADLFLGNSGTSIRFLTALVATGHGRYRLDGIERMRERPIADLLDALRELGVDARSEADNGCPPVIVETQGLPGGSATVAGGISSQFLTGLLMAAPAARDTVQLTLAGQLVSRPYIDMTVAVMQAFGIEVDRSDTGFRIAPQFYVPQNYAIEPDASAASYFLAAAAITRGTIRVEGLSRSSLQGDVGFAACLEQMGATVHWHADAIEVTGGPLAGIDIDMAHISDTAQTLAVTALFAEGPTRIRGIAHNRLKETDRIGDLATELRRLGAAIDEHDDGLTIHPGEYHGAEIETYDDHRMAMSLALAGLRIPGVRIKDPECTAKTYPNFFKDLAGLGGQ